MSNSWPIVTLGEVLRHRSESIRIGDLTTYRRLRVRLRSQGIVLRDEVPGALIKTKTQQVCHGGDFLVAEIDAKVGGFGIVPDSLDGAIVSSHYFLFELDETRIDKLFLHHFVKTQRFQDQVRAQGSTNYAAIRLAQVLEYEIPLPPLEYQHRLVAWMSSFHTRVSLANTLRSDADRLTDGIPVAAMGRFLGSSHAATWEYVPLGELCEFGPQNGLFKRPEFFGDGIRLLNVADTYKGLVVSVQSLARVRATEEEVGTYRLLPGDVCVVRSSIKDEGIGRACVFPGDLEPVVFECHLIRIRPARGRILPEFAAMFINHPLGKGQIMSARRAAVMTTINQRDLRRLIVPVPPLAYQERLLRSLASLQRMIASLKVLQVQVAAGLESLESATREDAFGGVVT